MQQVPSGEKDEGRVFSWLEHACYIGFALLHAQQQRGCSDVGGEASHRLAPTASATVIRWVCVRVSYLGAAKKPVPVTGTGCVSKTTVSCAAAVSTGL